MKTLLALIIISFLTTGAVLSEDRPSDWQSLEELRAWLEEYEPCVNLIADSSGTVQFDGQCEDTAFAARDRALADGKLLETEILTRSECIRYQSFVGGKPYLMRQGEAHYINKAVIGNSVYYVNVITDRLWFAYYLD